MKVSSHSAIREETPWGRAVNILLEAEFNKLRAKLYLAEWLSGGRRLSYCRTPVDASAVFPIASPESTSSTRRFCCRPSGVSFDAIGSVLPNPLALIEGAEIPCWTR